MGVKELKKWLEFAIENQEGIREEWEQYELPAWNQGYLEALNDMEKVLNATTDLDNIDAAHLDMPADGHEHS